MIMPELHSSFPRYEAFQPAVPVWCLTPRHGGYIHRFFDTSPVSPSGRYVALTRLPAEDRPPKPGERAQVVLVDLQDGAERIVAGTLGWDTQLGAQVQWGADDTHLLYNDMDPPEWRPYAVCMDPLSGARRRLEGTVYMISPDGRFLASPSLIKTGITQKGYGVIVPPDQVAANVGAPEDDGLFVTNVEQGSCRLLVSLREIVETAEPRLDLDQYRDGDFYAFHVKWNARGDRLMLVIRWKPRREGKMRPNLITMRADGSDIRLCVPDRLWKQGGHHPNWCPDGEHAMMNLKLDGQIMRLIRARYDGSGLEPMTEAVLGSGHPTLHPDGRHVVTDAYQHESVAFGDGTTPIRWINLEQGTEQNLVRLNTKPPYTGRANELRVDPHPAWDYAFRRIVFNGCDGKVRRVYLADLTSVLEG